jgi:hypothetical protein
VSASVASLSLKYALLLSQIPKECTWLDERKREINPLNEQILSHPRLVCIRKLHAIYHGYGSLNIALDEKGKGKR